MGPFEFTELRPEDVQPEWQSWYESEHTQYYTRSGRKMSVLELKQSIAIGSERGNLFTLAIVDTISKNAIGTAKIGPIDPIHGLADFAIFIGERNFLGKGLSAALIEEGCDIAFSRYGVRKLHSGILERNVPSIKAYVKAGWIVEGVLHKHYKNGGIFQDWIMISKFNPEYTDKGQPRAHALDITKYIMG
jgi:ribosomal-protein-alanine N-acetyltransferase